MLKSGKRGVIAATLVALLALAGGARYFFPIELAELGTRWDLWRAGVKSVESAGIAGYVQNYCDAKKPEACRCVALIHGLADQALTWKKILGWPRNGWPMPLKIYAWDLPLRGQPRIFFQVRAWSARPWISATQRQASGFFASQ
jgi:hypothetical protein